MFVVVHDTDGPLLGSGRLVVDSLFEIQDGFNVNAGRNESAL